MKSSIKLITLSLALMFIFVISPTTGLALEFNSELAAKNFTVSKGIDAQVTGSYEGSSVVIKEVVNSPLKRSQFFVFNEYEADKPTDDWGCNYITKSAANPSDPPEFAYGSYIVKKADGEYLNWPAMGPQQYMPHSFASKACLAFEQRSYAEYKDAEFGDKNEIARADKTIYDASIGQIQFDVMCFLNNTFDNVQNKYLPKSRFHFELDDPADNSETIHIYFQTENRTVLSANNFTINAYVKDIDPATGKKTKDVKIFENTDNPGNFNWLNVKVFYDCFNDVYNITIVQLRMDNNGTMGLPVSYVMRGQQHDTNFKQIRNVGSRIAPSHVVNALDFWLESTAKDGTRSYAYVDNIRYDTFKIAGVYGNMTYENSTIRAQSGQIAWQYINNSLITAYEPPTYPALDALYPLSFNDAYLNNIYNPSLLTPLPQAPSWINHIPMVVTSNHTLNVQSILHVLNSVEYPIETRGINQPLSLQRYGENPANALNAQLFQYNDTMSNPSQTPFTYYFTSKVSSQIILVEYYRDLSRAGIIKKIEIYASSIYDSPFVQYTNGWGNVEEGGIPGYPIEIFFGCMALAGMVLLLKISNRKH